MFRRLYIRLRIAHLQLLTRWAQDEIDAITDCLQVLPAQRENFQRQRLGLIREMHALQARVRSDAMARRFKVAPPRRHP